MHSDHAELTAAIAALRDGHLVGLPTETVYGLAANALNAVAVARIFEAKKRPHFDPLIVHIGRRSDVDVVAREVPAEAAVLMEAFWPGPLTLVLPKQPAIPDLVTSGLDTVALRMPQHPVALELLQTLDFPLAAPSANPFGYVSPTTRQHVLDQLADEVALVLEGGPCTVGVESTIVGFPDGRATVLRLGGLSVEALESCLGHSVKTHLSSSQPHAPGQLDSHYAPARAIQLVAHGEACPAPGAPFVRFFNEAQPEWSLSTDGTTGSAAARLFGLLRRLDEAPDGPEVWIEKAPEAGLGRAINDRLTRAAHRV
jgi:L-threonylcarbamoyladenylate synthase